MIAVSVAGRTPEELIPLLEQACGLSDVVEVRIDHLARPTRDVLATLVSKADKPVILTNRSMAEGGGFQGDAAQALSILKEAMAARPAYLDIELRLIRSLGPSLVEEATRAGIDVIVSWHDFSGTPSPRELSAIFLEMEETGAFAGKIVTMAQDSRDFLKLMPLFERAASSETRLIAFCMGEKGLFSRVAAPFLGSMLTFSALDGESVTAPGQIPVQQLEAILKTLGARDARP